MRMPRLTANEWQLQVVMLRREHRMTSPTIARQLRIGIASGPRHEAQLVIETLGQRFVCGRLVRLIGDKAYDGNGLDAELRKRGIDMIAPNLSTRAEQNQDLRKLRRYRRRWLVERLFAWLMKSRRLVTRYEHKAENFLGLLQLACVVILLRRF
jgi:transposase